MMLDFLSEFNIPHEICGKIIVATRESELPQIDILFKRGLENGLEGLERIGPNEIRELEPHVAGIEAIRVPQSGIADYPAVSRKLSELITEMGAEIRYSEPVTDWTDRRVKTTDGEYSAPLIINCAGLQNDILASKRFPDLDVRIIPFRGEYYELSPSAEGLIKNLVYPVPDPAFPFLGVHFTRMIQGGIEAGPNAVFALAREGYSWTDIDLKELGMSLSWPGFRKLAAKYWKTGSAEIYRSLSKKAFTKALQKLVPEIRENHLKPGGSGVRAQACFRDGKLLDDFDIRERKGEIHLINAPSPAATSSLSIGLTIAELAKKKLEYERNL